ncbi:selenocysteine-specific translation elongation factor [Mobilicoccus pelagius]|uniref:Selenocysteine-specific elongation factor n=1 Tax=Mobilicoccus pelagius NBRC 104925 TaxID=1089455 RepID=H5URE8_9MICO|nr:selenocysteine-specific translation elongation factor [Mobilicoccus pelagius]GAB48306.1 selenocysteine-specific elongation factor [Mobilicoccus pelagius NBRC 104925]
MSSMSVVATAGHVDHGKSTLVKALTGIEPDRWEEEQRRALTIDLGYAWTTLPGGGTVAFVDVPGHRRFIGNMLAGLGPVPAVMFVVAADESWMPQSAEHLAAAAALGVEHALLVVTRADLADPAPALARARAELSEAGLAPRAALAVSARAGAGMDELRAAVADLVAALPAPDPAARVRLWIDRAFTINGAGTVVTGTLPAGTIRVGDTLDLLGRRVSVRGLHSLEQPRDAVSGVARVAVNLRGVATADLHRGQALLTPGAWHATSVLDVRLTLPEGARTAADLPEHLMLHIGTAAHEARVRPLGSDGARLTLAEPLPLAAGDRAILRDPGTGRVAGALVLDVDPPELRRRGAGARRAEELAARAAGVDLTIEVRARGYLGVEEARRLGVGDDDLTTLPAGIVRRADLLVDERVWSRWQEALSDVTADYARTHPLEPWMPADAARTAAGIPRLDLVGPLAEAAGLTHEGGRVHEPGIRADLGAAEAGLARIEARLAAQPFAAPEQPELDAAGLGPREVAAAVRAGRLLRLDDGVLLQPIAPAKAMRILAGLPQPFTTSEARKALDTTRRVAIPLLEHLDAKGWTRRLDAGHREVAR